MVRFGMIGTNFISDRFVIAGKEHPDFSVNAIYSRRQESADNFAKKHGIPHTFLNLEEMASSGKIDAVYVASPTRFHAEQTCLFLSKRIPVLCEKPAASNLAEVKQMIASARKYDTLLMDAMMTPFEPRLRAVQEHIDMVGKVRRIVSGFSQYSSRYDAFKQGEILNAFNPTLSNGAVMDIGIYVVEPVVRMSGLPNRVLGSAIKLSNGVDGAGSMILSYDEMEAVLTFSKISRGEVPTEIQGEDGTLLVYREMREAGTLFFVDLQGNITRLEVESPHNKMYYEIAEFIALLQENKKESTINHFTALSNTFSVLDEYRRQTGIFFPADKQ